MREILLVTGASSDIGSKFIQETADDYSFIWAHYCHSFGRIEELQMQFKEKIIPIRADFQKEEEIENVLASIKEDGRIPHSILHIPAQPMQYINFEKLSWEDYEAQIHISVKSVQMILEGILPYLLADHKGHILFLLSACTVGAPPKYLGAYCTVKYALLGMMKALSIETADKGIVVNGISPEMIETRFLNDLPHLIVDKSAKDSPIGRNLNIDDIIPVMKMLLSDKNVAITGENIPIAAGKR